MVELTAAVALENFSARFNQAFAIEPLVLSRQ
jgi:alkylhydroperoxidase family enzyme